MKRNVLGERLKELRMQTGIKQKVFADAFNVSSSAVSKWENGQNEPDMETLLEIAGYYGISIEELLRGEPVKAEGKSEDSDSKDENPDSKNESACREDRGKWLGVGIVLGCAITVVLVTVSVVLWQVWRAGHDENSSDISREQERDEKEGDEKEGDESGLAFPYEIVAGRPALFEYAYEVSVFYSGEFSTEYREEIITGILAEWVKGTLCGRNMTMIKVICNTDRELAENYETNYPAVIFYFEPNSMEYEITR